ncbi:biofilm PGA synthesis N-glycosyltransferase PgaC [Cryobacterium sp. MP_M5]|uniref:glycosyltransferase family 2 protein n=1 Tax=unclassified Cryobacterium TaxID=2649013 RepID=UPI0018CAB9CD|nr:MULTISPECIES: glycosyltransferase family 2 protein [unclassified Cryobacterium]MBG6059204.1 cellulose synthase/poly-beta-1,6-N-acetylglucosamine synthase-like glycosyltransferase [Cryobacterium sp. MP_M3]MEC5177498.1 biofilm PGA synthesis N-glycosyltransferase PgaC [Cryobacterium sp. MP_M5]
MLSFLVVLILVMGVNTALWGSVGAARVVAHWARRLSAHGSHSQLAPGAHAGSRRLTPDDVAVLVAAHNEELVIANTIRSAAGIVPVRNIFISSDASSDATADIARECGANVVELLPNRGKAGALVAAIDHFHLADRFAVVMLLDADTQLAPDYMATGLPFFDDPEVVAVAGRAATVTSPPSPTRLGRFLVAYRERFYVVVQYLLKFGQAARPANVVSIVPGFASMYRSRILADIDICAPGLAIEDFNMTFEVHAKKLGRIAFHPRAAIAYTQDPDTLRDYTKQLRRWTLGFWQTVRRHGFRYGRFWGALALYVFELITSSIMMLLFIPLLMLSIGATVWEEVAADHTGVVASIATAIPPTAVFVGVLLPDYLLTVLVVIVTRRPRYLVLGFAFPLVRVVDAAICLWTLPQAFFGRSTGTWKSPARRSTLVTVPDHAPGRPVTG